MVDHRAVHPAWAAVVGPLGFPSLEGRTERYRTRIHPMPQLLQTHTVHLHSHVLSEKAFQKILISNF